MGGRKLPFCEWSCFWMAPQPVFYTFFEVRIEIVQFNLLGARVAKWQSNDKPNKLSHLKKLKWNPNSQGMLNWILQTLHYYCRKHNNNWKKCCYLFLPLSQLTGTCASFVFLNGRVVFSALGHSSLQNFLKF